MDDTMSMDDDSMSMSMTFSSWSTYQIQILFSSWDIDTKWQYVLSWFTVVLAAIFYHAMRYWVVGIESELKVLLLSQNHSQGRPLMSAVDSDGSSSSANKVKIFQLRLFHAFMSSLTYGLGLMLMLIAMTFNPGIFLALVVGYFLGDLIFYHITGMGMPSMNAMAGSESSKASNERL